MLEHCEEQEKNKNENEIENNGVLLISELQNKILLPYTKEEVEIILQNDREQYKTAQEVIDKEFTKTLEEYKDPFVARFKEAYELVTKRDQYSKIDGFKLGLELFGQKYLNPAIIAACKNIDELDVYLDCLRKNELDDFKIFEIKYELYPMIVKDEKSIFLKISIWKKFINFVKRILEKNKVKRKGKRKAYVFVWN